MSKHQEHLKKQYKEFVESLSTTPPEGCTLKPGDRVRWTNDFGVEWESTVLGFRYGDYYGDKYGKHVMLASDSMPHQEAYWFPHHHATLVKIS